MGNNTPIRLQLLVTDGGYIQAGDQVKIASTGFLGGGIERSYPIDTSGYVTLSGEWRGRDITSLWYYDLQGQLKYRLAETAYVRRDGDEPVPVRLRRA